MNDARAPRRADAGIAMGRGGSEAAKEASVLVLADDNFASIAHAVREGRAVCDNLRKVIAWTLPTNAGEAAVILLALALWMELPSTPIQILWVNLVTDVTLGIALAYEPAERGVMRRPPRPPGEPLLTPAFVWHVLLVSGLVALAVFGVYAWALHMGHSVEMARTLAVNTLVVLEIFHLFNVRALHGTALRWDLAKGTPVIWLCIGLVALGQVAITYWPPLQAVFGTEAVPVWEGLGVVGLGAAVFLALKAEKMVRLPKRRGNPLDGAPPGARLAAGGRA